MAGAGQRFVKAGFTVPKPLIPVGGVPMAVRAARSLPAADQWLFVCREEHLRQARIEAVLQQHFAGAVIIGVEELTQGQVCTCLLAKPHLRADDALTIGACDNAMTYAPAALKNLQADPQVDAWIWTFRHNPAVLQNPRMYGWVAVDRQNYVQRVSCKVPLSDTPMNDHAVIGAFTFKRAADFLACSEAAVAANRRINGEFYMDEAMNVAIESGLKVKVFEVDRYICWGTPQDVALYDYWRDYFQQTGF
jgi:dTDP-glucose pyrophosphorylase